MNLSGLFHPPLKRLLVDAITHQFRFCRQIHFYLGVPAAQMLAGFPHLQKGTARKGHLLHRVAHAEALRNVIEDALALVIAGQFQQIVVHLRQRLLDSLAVRAHLVPDALHRLGYLILRLRLRCLPQLGNLAIFYRSRLLRRAYALLWTVFQVLCVELARACADEHRLNQRPFLRHLLDSVDLVINVRVGNAADRLTLNGRIVVLESGAATTLLLPTEPPAAVFFPARNNCFLAALRTNALALPPAVLHLPRVAGSLAGPHHPLAAAQLATVA